MGESRWLALVVAVAVAPALQVDQLKMGTAAILDGTYVGGDQRAVRFQSIDGATGRNALIDTADLAFLLPKAPASVAATAAPNLAGAARGARIRLYPATLRTVAELRW